MYIKSSILSYNYMHFSRFDLNLIKTINIIFTYCILVPTYLVCAWVYEYLIKQKYLELFTDI